MKQDSYVRLPNGIILKVKFKTGMYYSCKLKLIHDNLEETEQSVYFRLKDVEYLFKIDFVGKLIEKTHEDSKEFESIIRCTMDIPEPDNAGL